MRIWEVSERMEKERGSNAGLKRKTVRRGNTPPVSSGGPAEKARLLSELLTSGPLLLSEISDLIFI